MKPYDPNLVLYYWPYDCTVIMIINYDCKTFIVQGYMQQILRALYNKHEVASNKSCLLLADPILKSLLKPRLNTMCCDIFCC